MSQSTAEVAPGDSLAYAKAPRARVPRRYRPDRCSRAAQKRVVRERQFRLGGGGSIRGSSSSSEKKGYVSLSRLKPAPRTEAPASSAGDDSILLTDGRRKTRSSLQDSSTTGSPGIRFFETVAYPTPLFAHEGLTPICVHGKRLGGGGGPASSHAPGSLPTLSQAHRGESARRKGDWKSLGAGH